MSRPIEIGMSQRRSETSSKPARSRISLVVSASAIENGPGPQVGSSYSSGRGTIPSTIVCARYSQSLSTRLRHTTISSRPPGTSAPRTARIAATGLAKNIVPKREKARSNPSSPDDAVLDVRDEETRVLHPRLARLAHGVLDESRRRVHADGLALGAHELGEPLGGVAEPAADVQHALAGLRRVQAHRLLAVGSETGRDGLAKAHEALVERAVPGANRLLVVLDQPWLLGCAHRGSSSTRSHRRLRADRYGPARCPAP